MNNVSIGDMALTFQNRRHNVQLKTDLQRLSDELASGHKKDLSSAITGDLLPVTTLEHALKKNAAYATTAGEAALVAQTMQASLELVQQSSSDLGPALLTASSSDHPTMIQTASVDAKYKLEAVLSAFNTRVADRYAFSGVTTDTQAFADSDTILASLQIAIAAETTAAGIEAVVDDWFDTSGGGFETVAYTGSNTKLSPVRISETDTVDFDITASDTDVREILKGFAMAALIGEGALAGDSTEQALLTRTAGEKLLTSDQNLSILRAKIGSAEARIDTVSANNSAQTLSLETARSELTAIDPFRTATELEAVRAQLETFYTVTARLSRLSLTEYLR